MFVAGPEGFEPSTIPRTSPVELALQVKSFSLWSLLLYLAEPPDRTRERSSLRAHETRQKDRQPRFLISIVNTHLSRLIAPRFF